MNRFHAKVALLIVFLSALVVACNGSPSAPTAEGPPIAVGPATGGPQVNVELKGRVVDDLDKPVAAAMVALDPAHAIDHLRPPSATTDGNGTFAFTAAVRFDGGDTVVPDNLPIRIDRDGYESADAWIPTNSDATITIYPTTKILPGSTLRARIVATAPYACGSESYRCRRIVVEPAGEPVVVEILQTDGESVGLVDDEPPLTPFDHAQTVTVIDGEVFIIGGPAAVTLRARRPVPGASADSLVGQYTLTLANGCAKVPAAARTRTYTASIEPAATGFAVTLSDAEFLTGAICTATASRLGCHQFFASREEDRVRFDLINADEWHGGYITERVPPGTWLQVFGSAVGRLEGGAITATGSGGVWYCTTNQTYPFPCNSVESCEVTDLRLTFTRR